MKRTFITWTIIAALVLSLAGCGNVPASENETPVDEPPVTEDVQSPAEDNGQAAPPETDEPEVEPGGQDNEPETETGRQDGERFEAVIMLEGMEETVRYEHIRNEAAGFEIDYDYEFFERVSGPNRECFISIYDDPDDPENYLEVTYSAMDADAAAAAVSEALSQEYDLLTGSRELNGSGSCIWIEASELKGTGRMADLLQEIYIIPAADGCRIATAHLSIESAEGFGRRFAYMMDTLVVTERSGEGALSDEQALSAIMRYCCIDNPELEGYVNAEEYPIYWDITSSDEQEIVVLFRSYTGAQIRYYIDRITGDTYVTEFVPGITPEEERTEESLNVWEYVD